MEGCTECIIFIYRIHATGFWQWIEQNRSISFSVIATPSTWQILCLSESLALDNQQILKHMKVRLDGSYDNQKSILVSNQLFQNRPGYEVITAFKLRVSGQIVLVSRGWVSVNYDNKQLPTIEPVTGTQQLVGEIYLPSSNSFFLPQIIDTALQTGHYGCIISMLATSVICLTERYCLSLSDWMKPALEY